MQKQIFVNLPVRNLDASIKFFTSMGYTFNPQFTDETATCMIVSDTIFFMLMTHEKFEGFSPNDNKIADTSKTNEALIALSCDSRDEVDDLVNKAIAAGGKSYQDPQDYGFMYYRAFQDLDGHVWEYLYMDPTHVQ